MKDLKKITTTAMLTAVAVILGYFAFPIFPAVSFLEYDLCDVVIMITSFIFGPILGICSSLIVALYQAFLLDKSGIFGFIMNIVSTVSFILPASITYLKNKTRKGAIISLAVGFISLNVVMFAFNCIVTPYFMHTTLSIVMKLMPFIMGFNSIKGILNAVITYFLYKHISKLIKKFN